MSGLCKDFWTCLRLSVMMERMTTAKRWAELGVLVRHRRKHVLNVTQKDIQQLGGGSVSFQSALENGRIPNDNYRTVSDEQIGSLEGAYGYVAGSFKKFLEGGPEPEVAPEGSSIPTITRVGSVDAPAFVASAAQAVDDKLLMAQIGLAYRAADALEAWKSEQISNEALEKEMYRLIYAAADVYADARGITRAAAIEVGRGIASFIGEAG